LTVNKAARSRAGRGIMRKKTDAEKKAQAKYDKEHCRTYNLKLNIVNDADLIERLDNVKSKQGYIKQLIRDDIRKTETEHQEK
jgi:hypothetical protein